VFVHLSDDRTSGAILDLRCETSPVAKTDQFLGLADSLARSIAGQETAELDADAVTKLPSPKHAGKTLGDELMDVFGLLRENIRIGGCRKMTGAYLCSYVHHDGKSGVLIALDAAPNPESVGVDLCHHVVFSNPLAITREDVPSAEIDRVRKEATEMAEGQGKPPQIIEKIVAGKVNAYCAENALMEQEHVKVSKTKVCDVLKEAGVTAITDLCFFKIG
jgi:elongation factor Ts